MSQSFARFHYDALPSFSLLFYNILFSVCMSAPDIKLNFNMYINSHLPLHLREVCDLLARGVIRLHDRNHRLQSSQLSAAPGESSLHFLPDQRGHAKPKRRPA